MKKYFLFTAGFIALSLFFVSKLNSQKNTDQVIAKHIEWMSLEKAYELVQSETKPILIDVYTDWCKWCKVMDQQTFQDQEVIQYVNENFYAVKLNAEQKASIQLNGKEYEYVNAGRRGINTITVELLGNRPSYPSLVLLDDNLAHKEVLKGFQKKEVLLPILANYKQANFLTSN